MKEDKDKKTESRLDTAYLDKFETSVHNALAQMLVSRGLVDRHLPETTDIEDKWQSIVMSYLNDGVREFNQYPTVSLGWMMFIGMAIATWWDEDWAMYSLFKDPYKHLLEPRGYDALDDHVLQDVLHLDGDEAEKTSKVVGDCATLVLNMLEKEHFEPGTPTAFNAYVRCLHQLYYFGAAMQLKRLGYKMTPMG